MTDGAVWGSAALGALSLLVLRLSLNGVKRRRFVDDTPTSKTTGVFIGMVELVGHTVCDEPLISTLAETACVHYQWSISEEWEKQVRETYTDSEGKTRTRTRTESGWDAIASGGRTISFYLEDDHGRILVHPEGADLHTETVFSETCTPGDAVYFAKGPRDAIPFSTHRRRFHEEAIAVNAPLYVIGQARERADTVAAEIAASKEASLFMISVRGEKRVRSSLGWRIYGWFLLGSILAYGAHQVPVEFSNDQPWPAHLVAPVMFFLLWCAGWTATVFNSITGLRRRVEQAASNVDVMLKRRSDLIPSLVETVQVNAAHEASLQENLARLRAAASVDHPVTGTLRSIAEAYPNLSTQSAFLELQSELTATETRIALARAYHAEIASFFNARTECIPDRWICRLLPSLRPFKLNL